MALLGVSLGKTGQDEGEYVVMMDIGVRAKYCNVWYQDAARLRLTLK